MATRSTKKTPRKKVAKKKVTKKAPSKPASEKTTRDLDPKESVDFLVRLACMVIPQGANPADVVDEYRAMGAKIKKAIR